MELNYDVKNNEKSIDGMFIRDETKNITDSVRITINIEMDRKKYEALNKNNKDPLKVKVAKLFGFK